MKFVKAREHRTNMKVILYVYTYERARVKRLECSSIELIYASAAGSTTREQFSRCVSYLYLSVVGVDVVALFWRVQPAKAAARLLTPAIGVHLLLLLFQGSAISSGSLY